MDEINPYQAPESIDGPVEIAFELPLGQIPYASRWRRLGGQILDTLIVRIAWVPVLYLVGIRVELHRHRLSDPVQILCLSLLGITIFLAIQGVFIYTRGQTLGKLLCGTVVVTRDFRRASGNRYLFRRLVPLWIIGQIPLVGAFFAIADALAIFREEKNCIHDDIAGTRVVMYRDLVGDRTPAGEVAWASGNRN
jgi:uncharacterized RDD family membrane protein YckC